MKRLICVLLCICFVASITSCAPKDKNTEIVDLELACDGISKYKIVYPTDARSADTTAVFTLVDAFKEATGIELLAENDMLKGEESNSSNTHRILIGKTNYPESLEAFEGLKHQDYKISVHDTNIVIAAFTSSGYNAAVEWLKQNVFCNIADGVLTMGREGVHESLVSGYQVQSWTINGVPLEKFKIVYSDKDHAKEYSKIAEKIAVRTGYYLDLVLDSESEPTQYEILIGDTNRAESSEVNVSDALNYTFRTVNGKLVIKAGGRHSYIRLLDELVDIITKEAYVITMNDSYVLDGNFFDDSNDISLADGTDIRIMCANLMAERSEYADDAIKSNFEFSRRIELLFSSLEFYSPTVVGLQECCIQWRNAIKSYRLYGEKWQLLEFDNPNLPDDADNKVYSTIMFRKDLYELVESGMEYYSEYNNIRCRCFTWAILRDKATGQEFCIVSTHWDGGPDKVTDAESTVVQGEELTRFVKSMYYDYPVITMGDFNRSETTPTYKKYLQDTGAVDCKVAAQNCVNSAVTSGHGWGQSVMWSISIDHITATSNNAQVLKFETLVYNDQIWASDHSWLLTDIKFK